MPMTIEAHSQYIKHLSRLSDKILWSPTLLSCSVQHFYPSCKYWKYCSVLRSGSFSAGDVENYLNVTRCHLKSSTPYSRDQQFHPGATWASIEDDHSHQKKTDESALFHIMKGDMLLSVFKSRVEPIFVCTVQMCSVSAVHHSGHPDRCPKLTPEHQHHRRMLTHWDQNWSCVIFADNTSISP